MAESIAAILRLGPRYWVPTIAGAIALTLLGSSLLVDGVLGRPATPSLPPLALIAAVNSRPAEARTVDCPAVTKPLFATTGPGKRVALTFDDGPGRSTGGVLKALRAEKVHATFFVLGRRARQQPGVIRKIVAAGHVVGNHTEHHVDLRTVGPGTQGREIDQAQRAVAKITGRVPCLFRPPNGSHDATTDALAHRRGLQTVLWSVDTRDWQERHRSPAAYRRVLTRAQAGVALTHPIVLFHDGGGDRSTTVEVLRKTIRWYRSHGYVFTQVDGRLF